MYQSFIEKFLVISDISVSVDYSRNKIWFGELINDYERLKIPAV